jgi:hypothetical protein
MLPSTELTPAVPLMAPCGAEVPPPPAILTGTVEGIETLARLMKLLFWTSTDAKFANEAAPLKLMPPLFPVVAPLTVRAHSRQVKARIPDSTGD